LNESRKKEEEKNLKDVDSDKARLWGKLPSQLKTNDL
jgi:hypothetical protein